MAKMPVMDWQHQPLADSLEAFQARLTLYFEDQDITDKPKQATKIKIASGDEGMRRILSSGLSDADLKDPEKIWTLFAGQVDTSAKVNFRVHRLEFANIRLASRESITDFISRLRTKALRCEFDQTELSERLIEMIILNTPFQEFRRELLAKKKGASNGLAERFVRTVKSTLMKTNSQEEFDIALLHIRATPGEGIPSPGEIMFGRTIRTNLPSFRNHETKEYEENLQERQRKASALPGKDLLPLEPGQPVTYRQPDGSWMPAAVIADRDEPRSYDIRTPSGILRRNRIQLRDRITKAVTFAESPTESEDTTTRAHPQRNRRPPAHLADYTK
ncbi:hypothetical protein CAPTEDRAFT_199877 [Capitella teleta]|uniref:Uncharacterized protein n=1 Tax=Capitella teleta TaxID=283909 RepID=R7UEH7_CAPTE|nr:hypothetical protein CAPTEDRAFT_199877 [Capitella teleta]|eukprot:ELU04379.1 hypothetical protein CAPTEDRAFT_199877 [Capitella teleta]